VKKLPEVMLALFHVFFVDNFIEKNEESFLSGANWEEAFFIRQKPYLSRGQKLSSQNEKSYFAEGGQ